MTIIQRRLEERTRREALRQRPANLAVWLRDGASTGAQSRQAASRLFLRRQGPISAARFIRAARSAAGALLN